MLEGPESSSHVLQYNDTTILSDMRFEALALLYQPHLEGWFTVHMPSVRKEIRDPTSHASPAAAPSASTGKVR